MTLSKLLAGPIIRRCTQNEVNFWLVTDCQYQIVLQLSSEDGSFVLHQRLDSQHQTTIRIGERAFIQLITIQEQNIPQEVKSL